MASDGTEPPLAAARPGRRRYWLLLAAFAVLSALRLPHAWMHGRFLDEEATVFLAYAWHRPWPDALFRSFAGYWNLAASATTVVAARLVKAGILPLEGAPYLTMATAAAAQLVPAALILSGRARWLASDAAVVAALLTLLVMPATEEVFANVLHIQFHLALAAALALALDPPRGRAATAGTLTILFVAPLCGPAVVVLLPLLAARALLDRDRRRLVQTAALAAGAAVQLLLFFGASPMRGHLLDPATLAAVLSVRLVVLPLLGFPTAFHYGVAVHTSQAEGGIGWWAAAALAATAFAALLVVAARGRDGAVWLTLAALAFATASFGYGMVILHRFDLFSAGAGERYNFIPEVLLALTLVALAGRRGRGRYAAIALCALASVSGVRDYLRPLPDYADGPSWVAEVAAWRGDRGHLLAVWPRPWRADLSDTPRPCAPPDPRRRSADPRYCESGWIAGFHHPPGAR